MSHEPYFTEDQLAARISKKKVRDIYDDNNDGAPDGDAIDGLRRDASSKVDSYLAPMGILPIDPAAIPDEVIRLSLDVGVALASQRFPEVMRKDWKALMDQAEEELCRLRDGKTSLGAKPIPQTAVEGGFLNQDDPERIADPTQRHWDRMGDF